MTFPDVLAAAFVLFAVAAVLAAIFGAARGARPLDEAPRELRLDEHLLELARKERDHVH